MSLSLDEILCKLKYCNNIHIQYRPGLIYIEEKIIIFNVSEKNLQLK